MEWVRSLWRMLLVALALTPSSAAVSNHSAAELFSSQFASRRLEARRLLEDLGKAVKGKVYVYTSWELNWLGWMSRKSCVDLDHYCLTKHAGDCQMAKQMLGNHPWRTRNPHNAKLFFIPALLGMATWSTQWAEHFTNRTVRSCQGMDFPTLMKTLIKKLQQEKFLHHRPHLIMTGGFDAFAHGNQQYMDKLLSMPMMIAAHFEAGLLRDQRGLASLDDPSWKPPQYALIHEPHVSNVCHNLYDGVHGSATQRDHHRALHRGWLEPIGKKPIALHFRGTMTLPVMWRRQETCERVWDTLWLQRGSRNDWRGISKRHRHKGLMICSSGHIGPEDWDWCHGENMHHVRCKLKIPEATYCEEMQRSRFALLVGGDSPTSQRTQDAMQVGSLLVVNQPGFFWLQGGGIIPWKKFAFDVTPGAQGRTLTQKLKDVLAVPNKELEQRRAEMLKWLPMVSWALDPETTSLYVLAQAARVEKEVEA